MHDDFVKMPFSFPSNSPMYCNPLPGPSTRLPMRTYWDWINLPRNSARTARDPFDRHVGENCTIAYASMSHLIPILFPSPNLNTRECPDTVRSVDAVSSKRKHTDTLKLICPLSFFYCGWSEQLVALVQFRSAAQCNALHRHHRSPSVPASLSVPVVSSMQIAFRVHSSANKHGRSLWNRPREWGLMPLHTCVSMKTDQVPVPSICFL